MQGAPSKRNRSALAWLSAGVVLLGVACAPQPPAGAPAPATSGAEARAEPDPAGQAGSDAEARSVPSTEARERMIGWWLRHDQGYMLVLDAIGDDGKVEARYLNPQPVVVSKAEVWVEEGIQRLFVELTDRNYPGNYYELAYRQDRDMWLGLYHHLGNDETYEVYFTRFED